MIRFNCFKRHISSNLFTRHNYSTTKNIQYCELTHQNYLKIHGKDQIPFLQGLTTNNITKWFEQAESNLIYTGILSPQGRVLFDSFIYRQPDDSLIIETHQLNMGPLTKHLRMYRLLSQVEFDDVSTNYSTHFSFGPNQLNHSNSTLISVDPRVPDFGVRYLSSNNEQIDFPSSYQKVDNEEYTLQRYTLGIPEGPIEIRTNQALPMESNMELMNGVHFSKGCYVGQELTTRTKHRGVIRKRIVPVTYQSEFPSDTLPYDLYSSSSKSKRSVGKLLAVSKGKGLALVKLTNVNDTLKTEKLENLPDQQEIQLKCSVPTWWPETIMENVEN